MDMRTRTRVDRRSFCRLIGVVGPLGAAAALQAADAAAAPALDLDSSAGRLEAFLKIYTSTGRARVWYWYSGVIDARLADGPVVPLIASDTLIRRDMTSIGDGRHEMLMYEGTYYHALDSAAPVDRFVNPLNGREVRPLHYREGPYHVGYGPAGPYDPKTGVPYRAAVPFAPRFRQAGDQIWLHRDNYIDVPHPLSSSEWPLESSGPRETVGSFATHWSSRAEVADPAVQTARSAFHYEAFMNWLPWLLMGATPGQLVWRCAGSKLTALADLPDPARAAFEEKHPRLFDEHPWDEHADLWSDYRKERTPAAR